LLFRPTRRSAPVLLALTVSWAAGTGCMRKADSTVVEHDPATDPAMGGAFHLMCEAPGTLDPSRIDDVYESCIINQLYDGLLEFDSHLNPVPAIAREWSVSRDGREYRFVLRDDVRFHNGRPVVAEDFVWSFTRIFDPARDDHGIGGDYLRKIDGVREYSAGEAERISGLTAVDDTILLIRLESPYSSFLSALAMDHTKVVCREALEGREAEHDEHPIGTGPFLWDRVADAEDHPVIVLKRNIDYFRGPAWLDEIHFHVPHDYNLDRGAAALLDGTLTMCDMPGSMKGIFEADPRFRLIRRPELSFSFIGINVTKPPFADVRVRRAVAHAIDRERILAVDPVGRIPAVGILPPGMFGYSPESKSLDHDPDLARSLLAEAGYPDGEGLPPVVHWQADRGEVGRTADAVLREDLGAVGIDVEFRYIEWDEFSRKLDAHDLESFGLTWVADVPDPDSFLASLFVTSGVYNLFRYSNSTVDSLLVQGAEMRGSIDRAKIYRRAERIILNDAPVVPLFHIANNFAVRAEVRDLQITPFGLGNLALERVWLAPSS
jgi:ABC-type transport system substrate-binding protein